MLSTYAVKDLSGFRTHDDASVFLSPAVPLMLRAVAFGPNAPVRLPMGRPPGFYSLARETQETEGRRGVGSRAT
jgi:hypothetical protein